MHPTGKEATREYDDVGHSDEADKLMQQYKIGSIDAASLAAQKSAKKPPLSAAPPAASGTAAPAGALTTYAVPLIMLVALFVAAKFFQVL